MGQDRMYEVGTYDFYVRYRWVIPAHEYGVILVVVSRLVVGYMSFFR